jgi:flagellar basal-body rod modification protein FlgD
VDDTTAIGGNLSSLNIRNKQSDQPKSNELGQTAFLELMITQLSNQDPLSPQDNAQFIAQLAQFSSVEGLQRLNESFDSFAGNFTSNRALQASSLVGRSVTVPGDTTYLLENQLVSGVAKLPATTTDLNINIYNASGSLVQQIPAGFQKSGDITFRWDGRNFEVNGEIVPPTSGGSRDLPPGQYTFEVTATQRGNTEQLDTAVSANVNSVTVEPNGAIILNLAGMDPVNLNDVKQFN